MDVNSGIKSTGSSITAVETSTLLPPKKLSPRPRRHNIILHSSLALIALGILTLTTLNISPAINAVVQRANVTDDFCDKQAASWVEQPFLIDIRLGASFTFGQAKIIDLVWDLTFGQGGRFFHGWLLYHHVIADALVWTMERSAVPYHYYINLSFSTVSFTSLGSLLRIIFSRQGFRIAVSSIFMIFVILYALAFPTLWGAATGYVSPTVRSYRMPDHSFVSLDSELMSLCWSLKDERLGFEHEHIEMGPTFDKIDVQRLQDVNEDFRSADSTPDIISAYYLQTRESATKTYANFMDLYACTFTSTPQPFAAYPANTQVLDAMSTRDIVHWLNSDRWDDQENAIKNPQSPGKDIYLYDPKISDNYDMATPLYLRLHVKGRPKYIKGWQYSGINQSVHALNPTENNLPIHKYPITFHLNDSIPTEPGIVPYNSTLWYAGEQHVLPAPFLPLSNSSCAANNALFSTLGVCVCYRGQPLTYDWYSNSNMSCISGQGYSWGFSGTLVAIGLLLEAVWVGICLGLWWDANLNSRLLKQRRRGAGVLRTVLDLAESVERDLGTATCGYADGELGRALEKWEDVGFAVEDRAGRAHIGVVARGWKRGSFRGLDGKEFG